MDFSLKDYLPNSEERIDYLRKIINGRPVAILAAGPSIKELENRISELRHADICYFGFGIFRATESIMRKINHHYRLIFYAYSTGQQTYIEDIINFLERDEDNMYISSFYRNTWGEMDADFDLKQFLSTYDKKLIFFSLSYDRSVPNKDQPLHFISGNSLQTVIQLAIIGKASRIILFGADGGYSKDKDNFFYKPYVYNSVPPENYILDTNLCFNPIMPLAIKNVYKTYNLPPIDILNCSEHSYYNPFPKVCYDDAFEYLLKDKKFNSKSDLRVPKLSVISTALDANDFLKETVENSTKQSYPNLEHIIVYNEEDDEIRALKQQFPRVKWIYEKGCKPVVALRKGISVAKGESICYFPVGDMFANPDWLNICMDILENHPEISLVWGLSQAMAENGAPGRITNFEFFHNPPPQGKDFIYYWLKKKNSFPEGSFCVRKSVLEKCFLFDDWDIVDERKAWLSFNYNFNTSGYLPFFVPLIANYHRTYFDQGGHRPQGDPVKMHLPYYVPLTENEEVRKEAIDESWNAMLDAYHDDIRRYKKSLMKGKIVHHYRNGLGEELPDHFNRNLLLFYDIIKYMEKKLSPKYSLILKRVSNTYKKYRWAVFKVGTIKILDRLIKIWVQKRSKQKDSVL